MDELAHYTANLSLTHQGPSTPSTVGRFSALPQITVDLWKEVARTVKKELSPKYDRATGVLYIAKGYGDKVRDRRCIKVGWSKKTDGQRVRDIETKCKIPVEQDCITPSFRGACRAESIIKKYLHEHSRPVLECECQSVNSEWFDKDLEEVKFLILNIYQWMRKTPYDFDAGILKPEWATALSTWEMHFLSDYPISLAEFFILGPDLSSKARMFQSPALLRSRSAQLAKNKKSPSPSPVPAIKRTPARPVTHQSKSAPSLLREDCRTDYLEPTPRSKNVKRRLSQELRTCKGKTAKAHDLLPIGKAKKPAVGDDSLVAGKKLTGIRTRHQEHDSDNELHRSNNTDQHELTDGEATESVEDEKSHPSTHTKRLGVKGMKDHKGVKADREPIDSGADESGAGNPSDDDSGAGDPESDGSEVDESEAGDFSDDESGPEESGAGVSSDNNSGAEESEAGVSSDDDSGAGESEAGISSNDNSGADESEAGVSSDDDSWPDESEAGDHGSNDSEADESVASD